MADLIDRQAAIDAFVKYVADGYAESPEDFDGYIGIIKTLPPAERKGEWIAASESLPEIGKKVLCLCQANIHEVLALTSEGWYHDEGHCYMRGFVVAWMPLPEPYEPEEGEEDG